MNAFGIEGGRGIPTGPIGNIPQSADRAVPPSPNIPHKKKATLVANFIGLFTVGAAVTAVVGSENDAVRTALSADPSLLGTRVEAKRSQDAISTTYNYNLISAPLHPLDTEVRGLEGQTLIPMEDAEAHKVLSGELSKYPRAFAASARPYKVLFVHGLKHNGKRVDGVTLPNGDMYIGTGMNIGEQVFPIVGSLRQEGRQKALIRRIHQQVLDATTNASDTKTKAGFHDESARQEFIATGAALMTDPVGTHLQASHDQAFAAKVAKAENTFNTLTNGAMNSDYMQDLRDGKVDDSYWPNK